MSLARLVRVPAVAAVLTMLASSATAAGPVLPVVQAVVGYQGALPTTPGVRVVLAMPDLDLAIVRGDHRSLTDLTRLPQVRGLALDSPMSVAGVDSDVQSAEGKAVFAAAGLGGMAGVPGAGRGVRVAVLDTGVSDSPALNRASGRLVDAVDTSAVTSGGRPTEVGEFTDGYGHGTFIADIVAGGQMPGTRRPIGIAPGARVLVVKVADDQGQTSLSSVLAGLAWVYAHADRVDVVNISLARPRFDDAYGVDPLIMAVEMVQSAGVAVVVAAGNDPSGVTSPGFDPKVLTVGALDLQRNRVAGFSGSALVQGLVKPDVVAAGVRVMSFLPPDSVLGASSTNRRLPNGLYRGTGTSQATAVVAGLAALTLAANPGATPGQVKAAVRCGAEDLEGLRDGAGAVSGSTELCTSADGQALDGSALDLTGEEFFDASSWAASSWAASSWAASSWAASSWAASSWAAASSWSASSWAASSWAASSWAASSWAARGWGDDE